MSAAIFFTIAALGAAVAGFGGLGLAMDRHWEAIHGRGSVPAPSLRRMLQLGGSAALAISLWCCLAVHEADNAGQAIVLWCGVLSVAAWGSVAVMTYAAQHARHSAAGAAFVACATAVLALVLR
ncbi:DUF3325 domain-containing protein [Pseudoduganella sp. SL102]|uniref:DUF3325 domain-containing protein n=1 Tax=Pseudoduganella sp. SL102 TaxID=2995154 RepID=UPI00248CB9CF|nr:DUF3325 domain-containing protein [Pseudoduganella sp. SL102]WBS03581.1 DUF3325 domain-containing protein [Pseudoduganella sp. SL102]